MGRGSEFQELGIAQSEITAAGRRMAGPGGIHAQHRYLHEHTVEVFFGTLIGMLLFALMLFWIFDPKLVPYAAWSLAVVSVGFVACKIWRIHALRKKRAEDLRLLAIKRDKTENDTEAKNA